MFKAIDHGSKMQETQVNPSVLIATDPNSDVFIVGEVVINDFTICVPSARIQSSESSRPNIWCWKMITRTGYLDLSHAH